MGMGLSLVSETSNTGENSLLYHFPSEQGLLNPTYWMLSGTDAGLPAIACQMSIRVS